MKSIRKPTRKKWATRVAILLITGALLAGTAYAISSSVFTPTPTPGPTEEQKEEQKRTEIEAKKEFIEANKDVDLPGKNPPTPSTPESIDLDTSQDKGTVTVSSKLYGYSAGSCRLVISNESNSISESADIIYQPDYSTCAGFSIVKTRLGPGDWTITLYATPAGGSELSKTISYTVK